MSAAQTPIVGRTYRWTSETWKHLPAFTVIGVRYSCVDYVYSDGVEGGCIRSRWDVGEDTVEMEPVSSRPIDTSKLEFRNPPDAPLVPPGWELTGIAADSQARVTLLMDRDDCVRGVYANQDQAEAERDKRNDDPSCTDSPYSTKTWNVDAAADSQAAGGELPAKVSPTSDEWIEAIVPLLTEKHNEAVRLRMALERIYGLLSSTGATPEADRTLSIDAANIANVALRWKP